MPRLLFFILLLALLNACGTMRSSSNIVAIDSSPRGLVIKNEKQEIIGRTPFFYKFPRNKNHQLNYLEKEFNYSCSYNWSGSLLPNTVPAPFGFPIGAAISSAFHLTDFLKGTAYNCSRPIKIIVKGKDKSKIKQKEKKVLILPPKVNDERLSDFIIQSFEKVLNRKEINYISLKKAKTILFPNNIHHLKDNNPQLINTSRLKIVAHHFQITHLAYLKITVEGNNYKIEPSIIDAFDFKNKKTSPPYNIKSKQNKKFSFTRQLVNVVNILPNAFTISYQGQPDEKRFSQSYSSFTSTGSETNKHPDALPKVFSLLGLETIHHPLLLNSWDYKFTLSPSFSSASWNSSYKGQYDINIASYNALFGAYAIGQTPFGQLTIGFALGAFYMISDDSLNRTVNKVFYGTKVLFEYKYFFGERWYATFGTNSNNPDPSAIVYQEYLLESWNTTYFGIGYYFPELKSFVRNLF